MRSVPLFLLYSLALVTLLGIIALLNIVERPCQIGPLPDLGMLTHLRWLSFGIPFVVEYISSVGQTRFVYTMITHIKHSCCFPLLKHGHCLFKISHSSLYYSKLDHYLNQTITHVPLLPLKTDHCVNQTVALFLFVRAKIDHYLNQVITQSPFVAVKTDHCENQTVTV